jgi:dihydrofolate reductase
MNFKLIVAVDNNGCIGINNQLPFKLKEDLKIFKQKTINNIVVMGRKTFESFGSRPLPNRDHYILSRSLPEGFLMENVYVFNTVEKLLDELMNIEKEVWVIGGGEIYNLLYKYCDEFHITHIYAESETCDTYFDVKPYFYDIIDENHYVDEKTNLKYKITVSKITKP